MLSLVFLFMITVIIKDKIAVKKYYLQVFLVLLCVQGVLRVIKLLTFTSKAVYGGLQYTL